MSQLEAIITCMPELSDRDRAILRFENERAARVGGKEGAIRATFEISAARYYQLLNTLILNPDALEAEPFLVKRLLRQREARLRSRSLRGETM